MRTKSDRLWDKFWRDDHGRVVIWQTPNAPLIAWVVLTLISLFLNGAVSSFFSWAGIVAMFIWALLEIFKGVNYFRRTLGAVVFIMMLLSIIHLA
jgi:hypothetical protein